MAGSSGGWTAEIGGAVYLQMRAEENRRPLTGKWRELALATVVAAGWVFIAEWLSQTEQELRQEDSTNR